MEEREIKFRAWLAKPQKMVAVYHWHKGDELDNIEVLRSFNGFDIFMSNEYRLMQFTGLKDRNGKEIYEGDIIQLADIVCAITFEDGAYQMITDSQQGRSNAIQDRLKRFEVIGNIYENPDLLPNPPKQ